MQAEIFLQCLANVSVLAVPAVQLSTDRNPVLSAWTIASVTLVRLLGVGVAGGSAEADVRGGGSAHR